MPKIDLRPFTWVPPPLPANRVFFPLSPGNASASNTLGNGNLRAAPFLLQYPTPIVALGAEIMAAGDVGSTLRLAVYRDNGSGFPGALLAQGTIPADAVATAEAAVSVTLPAGLLWIAAVVQGVTTTQPNVRVIGTSVTLPVQILWPSAVPGSNTTGVGYVQAGVTGALPDPAAFTTSTAGAVPRLWIRTAP
jgi:hypothetical protein